MGRFWRKVKVWQLVILLVIASGVSAELLRRNSLQMIVLRAAVIDADTKGDDAKITQSLTTLQRFVTSHMNTSMGSNGVSLQKTYQTAYEKAVQQGVQGDTQGHALYNQADAACQPIFRQTHRFPDYTQCVASKLANLASHDPLNDVKAPSVDLYRYNFVSPLWTPDAAGLSLIVVAILSLLLLWKIIAVIAYRLLWWLHSKHKKLA
ncbi:MAG TPA: hypothetical protein VNG90_02710 [Candidatus Acidoferrum sp.]|nr:hypothetical protein [Candidatus Acidoferrum sp.]